MLAVRFNNQRSVLLASLLSAFILFSLSSTAFASEVTDDLSWTGPNGYTMTGSFSYSSGLSGWITGSNLDSFSITGYENGTEVGSWDLSSGYAGYTFNFNFDVDTLAFGQGGFSGSSTGQDWDDLEGGEGCPSPGMGFSSGSGGQGLCVDGNWVDASFQSGTYDLTASPAAPASVTPEPSTFWLMLAGGAAVAGSLRRRFC
jgi:hypothetical protein